MSFHNIAKTFFLTNYFSQLDIFQNIFRPPPPDNEMVTTLDCYLEYYLPLDSVH